jgi:hypothetical protein
MKASDAIVEGIRRREQRELNENAAERATLEERHGQVWTLDELSADFTILGFAAPYVVAQRKSDGRKGSFQFQHAPRFYFNWQED